MVKKPHVIKERLSQMYCFGAEPHELINCLKECKQKLIIAGAKADNLPKTLPQKLRFLNTLQPKARLVIQTWFRTNALFPELDDPEKIVDELLLKERNDNDEMESLKPLWRAILGFYVSPSCPEIIERFLNNEPMMLFHDDVDECNEGLSEDQGINVTDDDIEQCLLICQGHDVLPSDRVLPIFVAGLVDTLNGEQEAASIWKEKLSKHALPMVQKLENIITEFEFTSSLKEADGVDVLPAEFIAIEDMNDYVVDSIAFVGVVNKLLPNDAFFVSPVGLFINDKLWSLSEEQAKILYPHRGEIIGFIKNYTKNFTQGELGVWHAGHRPSDKTAQYVLTGYQSRVYPVVRLPHLSSEPDSVREWLLTQYQPQYESPAIFLLDDGVALRLPGDPPDPKKYDFDVPLDSYRELTCIELHSQKTTIVTQLPVASEKYDCAPAGTWIKRLMKLNYSSTNFPVFNKTHLQNLTHFITEHEPESNAYLRALTHLEQIADSRELLDDMVQRLLKLPVIDAQINIEKKAILADYESEQEQLKQAIASLADKKTQLEAEIDKQKKHLKTEIEKSKKVIRQQEAELDSRIKQTFENASQAGVETLAQTALLRALVADVMVPVSQPTVKPESAIVAALSIPQMEPYLSPIATEITSKRQLLTVIEEQAAATGLSETLLSGIVAAANVTPIVGLLGKHTRKALSAIANVFSGGVRGEVSIHGDLFSISDLMKSPVLIRSAENACSMTLGDFLLHQQDNRLATVVELRGFNRIPPETLLPELSDCLLSEEQASGFCWMDQHQTLRHLSISQPILFVLTFTVGKSTFPLQGPIAHRLPMFLAESIWGDEQPANNTTDIAPTYVTSVLWQSLYTSIRQSNAHHSNEQKILQTTLKSFHYSDEKSQAITKLAFESGRSTSEKIVSDIEPLAPTLTNYAREITQGEAAVVLDCLFQS
ncbi:coiled-coil domain-containing protein [Pragia fontium]|uniref:coiled-coil domain-containing protein n=1 Tax=Pragia fontium TaxID=82985 RepID=UPI00064AA663|nr:kinetochore protein [Pragia fontium]AKJ41263.1 kinetochore protein [Pragia fontium]